MMKRHPKPNTKAALPPKLDQFLVDFSGKKLDKAREAQLSRIQASVLYVANPLTNLWAELLGQDLVGDPQAVIHVCVRARVCAYMCVCACMCVCECVWCVSVCAS